MLLKDLKEGDRVVISRSSSYYVRNDSNPTDSVKGTVDRIDKYSARVCWDNGKTNGYRDHDLVKVSETAPVSSELTKTPIVGKWYSNPRWSLGSLAKFKGVVAESEFGYSESTYGNDVSKVNSSWRMMDGVRLATESELRTLPKSHPDHPDKSSSSDKRGTPIDSYTPKKGDKVKVVANRGGSGVSLGDIGIVDHMNSDHCSIKVDGRTYYNYFDDLELVSTGVEAKTYVPKTGDKVKIIANRSLSSHRVGDIGTVGRVLTSFCAVEVPGNTTSANDHYFDELEFISSQPTKSTSTSFNFKEGDKIKIIARTNGHDFSIGATGILKGTKGASTRGGYYWSVDGIERKVLCNKVRECDMELVTDSTTTTSGFTIGDTVRIIANSNYSSNKVGDIGKITEKNSNTWNVQVPGGPRSSICTKDYDMEKVDPSLLSTRRSAILDPITGPAKVWRVKTRQEMIDTSVMESGKEVPSGWNTQMSRYFGQLIPSKFYEVIEKKGKSHINLMDGWCFQKTEITHKPLPILSPWDDASDDDESEYDDEDEEEEQDTISWKYDSDLDRLDAMSKEEVEETWFKDTPEAWPGIKRPKTEVEIIPHKSRRIF